ncbi:MAG: hypothetical protein IPH04_12970 [Saprospirales bacterium]|nr:hypothetical protein [Saprospirales bacterium]
MRQSKLLDLLRTLSGRQTARMEEYLASPYFNKNEELLSFYRFLKGFSPEYSHEDLDKKVLLKKGIAGLTLDAKRLAYWMSDLLKLTEGFLTVETLLEDPHLNNRTLLEIYFKKGLTKHYNGIMEKAERQLEEYPFRNAEFYYWQFQLRQLEYIHSDQSQRTYNPHLQDAANALDAFYLVEKLRLSCAMINLVQLLNVDYDLRWTQEVLKIAEGSPDFQTPAIRVYLALFRMLEHPEQPDFYFQAKEQLWAHTGKFDKAELSTLSGALFNFSSRRINRYNDAFFWKEYLEVGKFLLREELILDEGRLSPWLYKNLVSAGLQLGDTEWTHGFIIQYRHRLPESYQEPLYEYNLAHYYYHLRQYDEAQLTLMQVEFKDVFLALSTRSLLVKIFYETDQTELLFSHLEAFRIFLLRNKLLPESNRRQVQQFIDMTRKLAKIEKHEAKKIGEVEAQLPDASLILHRDWLLEKISERRKAWRV